MSRKPYNYIRCHRKRANLSRRDLAYLLGLQRPNHISRIELNRCLPNLKMAMACEVIFHQSLAALYPQLRDEVESIVIIRAQELYAAASRCADTDCNLQTLKAISKRQNPVPTSALWSKKPPLL